MMALAVNINQSSTLINEKSLLLKDDEFCPWRESYRRNHSALIQRWKDGGIFVDSELNDINCYWLQFEPAPLMNHLVLALIFFLVFVIGFSSNTLVLYIMAAARHLRTPSNILITNLAVSDLLMLFKLPIFIYNSLVQGPALGNKGCIVFGFLSGLAGCNSIMSLAAIALERFIVISRPLKVTKRPTRCWAYTVCVLIWIYSATFAGLPLLGVGQYVPEGYLTSCSFDYLSEDWLTRTFIFSFFLAAWVTPLTIIVVCYAAIILYVAKAKRGLLPPEPTADGDSVHDNDDVISRVKPRRRRSHNSCIITEVTIAKITIGLVFLWLVSWTPYAMVALMGISGSRNRLTPGMTMLPALFAKWSSSINPFIYAFNHPKIRKELARHCHCLLMVAIRSKTRATTSDRNGSLPARSSQKHHQQRQDSSANVTGGRRPFHSAPVPGHIGTPIIHFKSRRSVHSDVASSAGSDAISNDLSEELAKAFGLMATANSRSSSSKKRNPKNHHRRKEGDALYLSNSKDSSHQRNVKIEMASTSLLSQASGHDNGANEISITAC